MTLWEVKVNWRNLQMNFVHQGRLVTIQGDPSLSKEMITVKALRELDQRAMESMAMFWIGEKNCDIPQQLTANQEEQLQQVLTEFTQVFSKPQGLPPHRDADHRIPIKAGVYPINVQPYRYPYLQKNKIET